MEGVRKRVITLRKWFLQGGRCSLCQKPISLDVFSGPESLSLDHIKPKAEKGSSAISNLQATHERCNFERGRQWQAEKVRQRKEAA